MHKGKCSRQQYLKRWGISNDAVCKSVFDIINITKNNINNNGNDNTMIMT